MASSLRVVPPGENTVIREARWMRNKLEAFRKLLDHHYPGEMILSDKVWSVARRLAEFEQKHGE